MKDSFVHEAIGRIKADQSLLFTGRGRVQQKGVMETPLLTVGLASYDFLGNQGDKIQKVSLTSANDVFEIGADATFLVTNFEAMKSSSSRLINKGDFMVKNRLTTHRSLTNHGHLMVQAWTHRGAPLINKTGATLACDG